MAGEQQHDAEPQGREIAEARRDRRGDQHEQDHRGAIGGEHDADLRQRQTVALHHARQEGGLRYRGEAQERRQRQDPEFDAGAVIAESPHEPPARQSPSARESSAAATASCRNAGTAPSIDSMSENRLPVTWL